MRDVRMPAVSKKQRIAAAIALHQPGKLYKKNIGLLKMSKEDLRDYAKRHGKKRTR